jgi:hypothetical protein
MRGASAVKKLGLGIAAFFVVIVAAPGIRIFGNWFLHLTEPEYSVPVASSYFTFNCTKTPAY